MDVKDKIGILADAAKYDASCSSAGSARPNTPKGLGNGAVAGICHSWSADGRCISLLKVLLSNACAYDCAYCVNRRSNDIPRAGFEPGELVKLIIEFYTRNYIEGAFLSSGVLGCPDATMERLILVARRLRVQESFNGYLHLKIIPGASEALVMEAARWADRVSVNIELPSSESLARIAPDKSPQAIFGPMKLLAAAAGFSPRALPAPGLRTIGGPPAAGAPGRLMRRRGSPRAALVPAGQTTQLIVGASPESDQAILSLAERLYRSYDVRRVYYSAFVPTGSDPRLPQLAKPPLAREHRLYQADWLFRFYGFSASEILDPLHPYLDARIDPKSEWAIRNLGFFPLELMSASYEELLRVPGIGPKSAQRIIKARRDSILAAKSLSRLGIVMRRASWFITLKGRLVSDELSMSRIEKPDALKRVLMDPAYRRQIESQPELPWSETQ